MHRSAPRPGSPLVRLVTGRRTAAAVALLALLLAGMVIAGVGEAERAATSTDSLPRDADSTLAVQLQDELPDEDTSTAVVLWTGEGDGRLDQGFVAGLPETLAGVRADLGLPEGGPPPQPSEDGTAAVAVLPVPQASATDNAALVGDLRAPCAATCPRA